MEITGKVVRLGALTEGTSARGPWRKQDLIIETEEQFPKTVCLTCSGETGNPEPAPQPSMHQTPPAAAPATEYFPPAEDSVDDLPF